MDKTANKIANKGYEERSRITSREGGHTERRRAEKRRRNKSARKAAARIDIRDRVTE